MNKTFLGRNPATIILLGIIAIALVILTISFTQKHSSGVVPESLPLNKQIQPTDVQGYKMSKWVVENSFAKQADVSLTQQQVIQLVDMFNSIPEMSVVQVESVDPQISAGIVLGLKPDREIRIQYAKKEVYVTRNDLSNDFELKYYKVNLENIKGFFEGFLKES
ncbi:hypothetical protein [Cohnella sp. REN36]|uniref:hypothetical protein n=1 Tax=Cohnella sp. REN36 TaxID=2887347 RepID=UPI001D14DA0D|nr:hypothetical protein [Cohnella sp. REN36]MCC3375948.1 hypothetical protein [Cohnella sp. REN36]